MKPQPDRHAASNRTLSKIASLALAVAMLPASANSNDTESSHYEFSNLKWTQTPFGTECFWRLR